jgi:hypothetical protein
MWSHPQEVRQIGCGSPCGERFFWRCTKGAPAQNVLKSSLLHCFGCFAFIQHLRAEGDGQTIFSSVSSAADLFSLSFFSAAESIQLRATRKVGYRWK